MRIRSSNHNVRTIKKYKVLTALILLSSFLALCSCHFYNCSTCKDKGDIECDACNGTSKITCKKCNGIGNVVCSKCDGTGKQTCVFCDGKGVTFAGIGKYKTCRLCIGQGKIACSETESCECNKGIMYCGKCNFTGRLDCPDC